MHFRNFTEDTNPYEDYEFGETLDNQSVNESYDDSMDDGVRDKNALLESILVDQVRRMDDTSRNEYLRSDEFQNLCEAGVATRKTIVRFNKQDDLTRRIHLAALQKAKEENSPLWHKLHKNRIEEKKLLKQIIERYGMKVRADAIKSQRRLIKLSPKAFDLSTPIR